MIPFRSAGEPGRNDPCPCASGKKFKKCHGGLNPPPTPRPAQMDAELRKSDPKAVCLAPDRLKHACKGRVIASHTVSRSGSLGMIEKNGHVYSYAPSIQAFDQNDGRVAPVLRGWTKASTFPGFCSHHDKQLFAPLEDMPFTGSQHQCFLLAYRSFVWELYAKTVQVRRDAYQAALIAARSPELKGIFGHIRHSKKLGFRDINQHKGSYDRVLSARRWSECHGLLIEFDQTFPIQCSAGWSPETDIHGNLLQDLNHSPRKLDSAALVSFAADGKSYFLLCWLQESTLAPSVVADSIEALPESDLAGALGALLLLSSENCHMSPDWYDALSETGKRWVNDLVHPMPVPGLTPANAGGENYLSGIGVLSKLRF